MEECTVYYDTHSNILNNTDKVSDLNNFFIDFQKRKIINEINWLYQNYDDMNAISAYRLNLANFNNTAANLLYRQQFRSYSVEKMHHLVELRANFLYGQLKNLDNYKIDNKPLKVIIQELKKIEQ